MASFILIQTNKKTHKTRSTKKHAQSLWQGSSSKVTQKVKMWFYVKPRLYSKSNEGNPTRVDKSKIAR